MDTTKTVAAVKPTTVVTEQPKAVAAPAEKKVPEIKETPVMERLYALIDPTKEVKFRGKQRQIVADILKASKEPLSIKQIAPLAAKAGLVAIGGVEPSVRYHAHHLTLDGFTKVTNPTIVIE